MAIVVENIIIDGTEFTRTYSDAGRLVVRDGEAYDEAIDPVNSGRVYTEGDLIPSDESEEPESELQAKAEAYDIIIGAVQ